MKGTAVTVRVHVHVSGSGSDGMRVMKSTAEAGEP